MNLKFSKSHSRGIDCLEEGQSSKSVVESKANEAQQSALLIYDSPSKQRFTKSMILSEVSKANENNQKRKRGDVEKPFERVDRKGKGIKIEADDKRYVLKQTSSKLLRTRTTPTATIFRYVLLKQR